MAKAAAMELPLTMAPLRGLINRNLRNAIFHSDYSVYEGKVRIFKPTREYTREEALDCINLALAYCGATARSVSKSRRISKQVGHRPAACSYTGNR